MILTIFLLQVCKPLNSDTYHLTEIFVNLSYLGLNFLYQLVSLVLIELQNALHLDF